MAGVAESLGRHFGVSRHFHNYAGERIFPKWNTYTEANVLPGYFVRCEVIEQGVYGNVECNSYDRHLVSILALRKQTIMPVRCGNMEAIAVMREI